MLNCYVKTDSVLAEVRMPSTVAGFHQARKERLERIKLAAFSIVEVGAAPAVVPAPAPEPVKDSWAERQKRIPLPKPRLVVSAPVEVDPAPRNTTILDIQRACAKHYGVTVNDIVSGRRTKDVIIPRQVAMYLARRLTTNTFPQISLRFGKRDHTTALHGSNKIFQLLRLGSDAKLTADVATLIEALGGDVE